MTSIIDLYGLSFSILRQGDILSFLKVFVKTMDSHFPQRAHTTLLVNAPKWFHLIYKLVSPMMRESTKEKIKIFSNGSEQDEALKAQLSAECVESLPGTFWSTKLPDNNGDDDSSTSTQRESTLEEELRDFVRTYLPALDFVFNLITFNLIKFLLCFLLFFVLAYKRYRLLLDCKKPGSKCKWLFHNCHPPSEFRPIIFRTTHWFLKYRKNIHKK